MKTIAWKQDVTGMRHTMVPAHACSLSLSTSMSIACSTSGGRFLGVSTERGKTETQKARNQMTKNVYRIMAIPVALAGLGLIVGLAGCCSIVKSCLQQVLIFEQPQSEVVM